MVELRINERWAELCVRQALHDGEWPNEALSAALRLRATREIGQVAGEVTR